MVINNLKKGYLQKYALLVIARGVNIQPDQKLLICGVMSRGKLKLSE